MSKTYEYFRAYLCDKIDNGEKQAHIATSSLVNKTPSFINKMYKGYSKSCTLDMRRKIAAYFQTTHDEMIEKGKQIYEAKHYPEQKKEKELVFDNALSDPQGLLTHLNLIAQGIQKNFEALEQANKILEENRQLKQLILAHNKINQHLDEGITFFNVKNEFVFSSNRHGFLNGFDTTIENPTIESLVLLLRKKILNFEEVLDALLASGNTRKKASINVNFITGQIFKFTLVPIFDDDEFLGTALINTLNNSTSKESK